jgi:DNA-binding Xre family transcriptional regulator
MAQRTQIVSELKRALKESGVTYAAVARHLSLSLASVKRLFSTGAFSLQRIDEICDLLGIEMSDILERAQQRALPRAKLTVAQERQIVADPRLFLVTWLVLNRTPFDEIVKDYRFTERELQRYLIRLDRLRVILLLPMNRVRLLIGRHFSWRPGGPVQSYIHSRLLQEFLASEFTDPRDEFLFHGGAVSEQALARLKRALQNAARECIGIIESDTAPAGNGHTAAFLLALRPWQFTGFAQFLRE